MNNATESTTKPLNLEQMNALFDIITRSKVPEEKMVHHIEHRGCSKFFKENFETKKSKTMIDMLYGLNIYERMYVPFGEIWMCDIHGRPITKIKYTPKSNENSSN